MKHSTQVREKTNSSLLNGTGDVRCEFMCSEQLKDEVEQLVKLSFSYCNNCRNLINFYTPSQLMCVFSCSDPGYYF